MTRWPIAIAIAAVAWTSCVNVNYTRSRSNEPVPDAAFEAMRPGETTFAQVLEQLGAPAIVWPSLNGDVVLAYAWLDSSDWGISLSWNFERFVSARFEWDSSHEEIPAVVLQFDRDLELQSVKKGLLRELAPEVAAGDPGLQALQDAPR